MKLKDLKQLSEALTIELDADGYFTNKKDIEDWLEANSISSTKYTISDSLEVTLYGQSTPYAINDGQTRDLWYVKKLPVKFAHISSSFKIEMSELETLRGMPKFLNSSLGLKHCPKLNTVKSLEGIPSDIGRSLSLSSGFTDLRGLQDLVKAITRNILDPTDKRSLWLDTNKIKHGGLGLLLIDGLECVVDYSDPQHLQYPGTPWEIINRHLLDGRDVFACQQELIEAGFEEYAQL